MTNEESRPQIRTFSALILPWLAGIGMLGVFLATMDWWVTPKGLAQLADISGWGKIPNVFGPVTYLATYPLRWLPQARIPGALNLFSAGCGAITLGLLARSVALLPHDRTLGQRQREESPFSLLSTRTAWVPPLFAMLICGLQLTFWENALEATGKMLDLLLFAYVIRCLLEYRITRKESWLYRFAFVYGLGMANSWGMVGFFPLFLVALVWIKGAGMPRPGFVARTVRLVICGSAGFSLFFLLPIMTALSHGTHPGFWQELRAALSHDKIMITLLPRDIMLLLGLLCLVPIFVAGIRWVSYFDAITPFGIFVGKSVFHIAHALLLLTCIWVALDAPVSPRNKGLGITSYLSFYYLGALSVGYFTGYFLLIFGRQPAKNPALIEWRLNPPVLRCFNCVVLGCVGLLVIGVPLIMVRRNLPFMQSKELAFRTFDNYTAQVEHSLPTNGAVVLVDDVTRLYYLEAALTRDGKRSGYMLVDTGLLNQDPSYLVFLKEHNPRFHVSTDWLKLAAGAPTNFAVIHVLEHFAQDQDLIYIHPSVGNYFERFYPEADGLVYHLHPYPTKVWDAPLPTREQIAQNQAFWKTTQDDLLPPLMDLLEVPDSPPVTNQWGRFMKSLHLKTERQTLPFLVGAWYSRALDYWGVELEMAGQLPEARQCFEQAIRLNRGNRAAYINRGFNAVLASTNEMPVAPPADMEEKLTPRGGWLEMLNADGPIDEPNCRDKIATLFAQGGNLRQAVQQLDRIKELSPNSLRVPLQLAELLHYIQTSARGSSVMLPYTEGYLKALENIDEVLKKRPNETYPLVLKGTVLIQLKRYDEAIAPLSHVLAIETNDSVARANRALAYFKAGNLEAARQDYLVVSKTVPRAYQAYYSLGEIGYQQKNTPAAITNYELYLSTAPTNTPEAKFVSARLAELKTGAH